MVLEVSVNRRTEGLRTFKLGIKGRVIIMYPVINCLYSDPTAYFWGPANEVFRGVNTYGLLTFGERCISLISLVFLNMFTMTIANQTQN